MGNTRREDDDNTALTSGNNFNQPNNFKAKYDQNDNIAYEGMADFSLDPSTNPLMPLPEPGLDRS